MTVNWKIFTIHSLEVQTIQVGPWKMAADWLIKKENPIYASTFHIPRLIWYAWFNTKFPNLTWGREYCQASESKSLNPSVSMRSWARCCLPEQNRLNCRVRQMLKLNEDVPSHFCLLLNSSAQITLSQSLLSLPPFSSLSPAMSNSFSSSSQYRLCLARLTFIRQYHFPRGLKEHTMQLKCQGTSVYLCGYPYNETHTLSLHSEVTFFSKWRLHPSTIHSAISWYDVRLMSDYSTLCFLEKRKEPFDRTSPDMNEITAVRDYHAVSDSFPLNESPNFSVMFTALYSYILRIWPNLPNHTGFIICTACNTLDP